MTNFFADSFANCVVLAVLLLAMMPMIESKVAIPFALSTLLWGGKTLSPVSAFFVALAGSMIPAAFVILFARFVKKHTSGFVHERFLKRFQEKHKNSLSKLNVEQSVWRKCLMLATFVAIPLPLTGVWTGAFIGGLTNLKFWQAFLSVLVGEVVSCVIVILLCLVFENSAFYIFIFSLVLVFVALVVDLSTRLIKNRRANKGKKQQ